MIPQPRNTEVLLKVGATDMRKSINGLVAIVQERLDADPFSGSLFGFCNRQRKIIKLLYWHRNGFCIWHKRLGRDRFPWPNTAEEAMRIKPQELSWLLEGIDFFGAHREVHYSIVS